MSENTFTIRSFSPDDIPALAAVANAAAEHDQLETQLSEERLAHMLHAPQIDPERDFFVAVDAQGALLGGTLAMLMPETGRAFQNGIVHPDHRGRGIGTELLQTAEALVMLRVAREVARGKPVVIQGGTRDDQADTIALLEAEGYTLARYFYEMRRPLDQPITPPPMPDGLELRPFDRDAHAEAVYEAQMESFADHWGYVRVPFEQWAHHRLDESQQDFSLWRIAWDGDAVAGIALNTAPNEQHPDYAEVGILGVRRAWRKRGLGLALLLHSFAAFQARGWAHAGLGVDADSETNAVALYERAGMHVSQRYCNYRKMLRGRFEDLEG